MLRGNEIGNISLDRDTYNALYCNPELWEGSGPNTQVYRGQETEELHVMRSFMIRTLRQILLIRENQKVYDGPDM